MARLVEQMGVKTVINRVRSGKQNKFWIAGTKFDKWSTGDNQEVSVNYAKPQEVTIEVDKSNTWLGDNSVHNLKINDFNGDQELLSWRINQYGIKFFRNKDLAERYFLEKSHNLFKVVNPMLEIHKELHKKIEYEDPDFLEAIK